MLIATNKNGISRCVIYNEKVLLVDRGIFPISPKFRDFGAELKLYSNNL